MLGVIFLTLTGNRIQKHSSGDTFLISNAGIRVGCTNVTWSSFLINFKGWLSENFSRILETQMTAQVFIEIRRWNILHTIHSEILQLYQLCFPTGAVHRDIGRHPAALVFKVFDKSVIG